MADNTVANAQKKQTALTPAERATLFNKLTRRYLNNVETRTGGDNTTVNFKLPKTRLLAGCILEVTGTLKATHATETAFTADVDAPYSYIANITMSYNSAFSPFNISGRAIKDYNQTVRGVDTVSRLSVLPKVASSAGTSNAFKFFVELPNMLNDRDPVSLILLQSDETVVDINVTFGSKNDIAPAASGFTFETSGVQIALLTDTFSIPADANAFPDISVLKLVQERNYTVSDGDNTHVLSTGRTYRKLGLQFTDSNGAAMSNADIGNIQLVFNQATTAYNISPDMLQMMNTRAYGGALGTGRFVFDFSDNGQPNFGGARDYIDTLSLTEFWLRFNAEKAGTVKVWSECLVRLS